MTREPVDVAPIAVKQAERIVVDATAKIRARVYEPNPGPRCRRCEVRTICRHAKR